MTKLEHRIPPPLVVALLAVAMAIAAYALPALAIDLAPRIVGGTIIVALGFSWVARGFLTFRAAGTTIDPVNIERASTLVDRGVFGRSRNPMYVGFATMLVGWAMALAVPWTLLGPIVFIAFTHRFQIIPEERVMRARFGELYATYAARVPRWL